MKLEEELKTKEFRNPHHKLMLNIIYTHGWLIPQMQQVFKSYGITLQQYNILRILRGQAPKACSIQLLRDRMMDKQSDVSRLVDRLVAKKLVIRNVSKMDRRRMDIKITETGADLLNGMEKDVAELEKLMHTLSAAEATAANELLDKLRG